MKNSGWPRIDEDYFKLLSLSDHLNFDFPSESAQQDILKLLVRSFKAESAQFCMHGPQKSEAARDKTALVNLSWRYTNQYINYYHDLDPFVNIMPENGAFRNQDLMPPRIWRNIEFNEDFIKPQKITNLLVMRLLDSQRLIGHIGLFRHEYSSPFSVQDLYRARYLSSLFSQKISEQHLLQRNYQIDRLVNQLKTVPSVGVMVLDSHLKTVYSNLNMTDFELQPDEMKGCCTGSGGSSILSDYVISQCRDLIRQIPKSGLKHPENTHAVIWQTGRQAVDLEISILPVDSNPVNGFQKFILLLLFSKKSRCSNSKKLEIDNRYKLTPKEIEITGYLCQGLTNKEISRTLYISPPTVATHVQHILQKTGISRRSQLINRFLY